MEDVVLLELLRRDPFVRAKVKREYRTHWIGNAFHFDGQWTVGFSIGEGASGEASDVKTVGGTFLRNPGHLVRELRESLCAQSGLLEAVRKLFASIANCLP